MGFSEEKKSRIKHYLLEKIDEGSLSVVRRTADAFGVTQASVYKYLDALTASGVVGKTRRGQYVLVRKTYSAVLYRSSGELEVEEGIFKKFIAPYLNEFPENVRLIWDYLSCEMINNVIDHSGAETLEIELSVDALRTTLRLTDDGVGIFGKISSYFGLDDEVQAVGELLKGKLTTDEARHSGEGIFFSSRMADTFVILSSGHVFTYDRFDGDSLAAISSGFISHGGTTVLMTLANDSQKRAADIFDMYADVEGGFTRTRIPLRNYFEKDPVSRSQAKRLVSRLDAFSEVELDFEGIGWIGQGFAHELFRVFANAHPATRLIPLNMNEEVRRMYNHVTA